MPYYAALEVNVAAIMPYYSSSVYLDMTTAALGSENRSAGPFARRDGL